MPDLTPEPQPVPWWANMLVDGWKESYRWLSVRLAALIVVAPELYEWVPSLHEYLSPHVLHHVMGGLALLVIIGRLKRQQ